MRGPPVSAETPVGTSAQLSPPSLGRKHPPQNGARHPRARPEDPRQGPHLDGWPQRNPHAEAPEQGEGLEVSGDTFRRLRAPPALALRGSLTLPLQGEGSPCSVNASHRSLRVSLRERCLATVAGCVVDPRLKARGSTPRVDSGRPVQRDPHAEVPEQGEGLEASGGKCCRGNAARLQAAPRRRRQFRDRDPNHRSRRQHCRPLPTTHAAGRAARLCGRTPSHPYSAASAESAFSWPYFCSPIFDSRSSWVSRKSIWPSSSISSSSNSFMLT